MGEGVLSFIEETYGGFHEGVNKMTVNKSKGNMYPDTDTWNGMYGICPHNCIYCYNRKWWKRWGKMRLNIRALKDKLGSGKNLFVGSSCDMFAEGIPDEWIRAVLTHLLAYPKNIYLLQTKNTKNMYFYYKGSWMGDNYIYGTTLESNRFYPECSNAPFVDERKRWMGLFEGRKMVSIEPIMEFDLKQFVEIIKLINPEYVSIGANTDNKVKLPEPSKEKVEALIKELKKFTEVKIKPNLKRITGE